MLEVIHISTLWAESMVDEEDQSLIYVCHSSNQRNACNKESVQCKRDKVPKTSTSLRVNLHAQFRLPQVNPLVNCQGNTNFPSIELKKKNGWMKRSINCTLKVYILINHHIGFKTSTIKPHSKQSRDGIPSRKYFVFRRTFTKFLEYF